MLKTPLARNIAVTVAVKVVALFALWFFLIRPKFLHVSSADMTERLYGAPSVVAQSR